MELDDGATIANLLKQLELDPQLVAVELDLEIVPKAKYQETRVSDGATIEIVHFVGGG